MIALKRRRKYSHLYEKIYDRCHNFLATHVKEAHYIDISVGLPAANGLWGISIYRLMDEWVGIKVASLVACSSSSEAFSLHNEDTFAKKTPLRA